MEERQLGDYRLLERLSETATRTTWSAEQVSVRRQVVITEVTDPAARDAFLADIRAKAAVHHPLIGSVYEAVPGPDACFAAFEHLAGSTLKDYLTSHEALRPEQLAHILRRTAEAMIQLGATGIATEPLTPSAIHFDTHGVVRLENIATAGSPDPTAAAADIRRLGEALPPVVAEGHAGASRVLTVLAWMRGEGVEAPLTWDQIRSYGEQIESQLHQPSPTSSGPQTVRVTPRKPSTALFAGLAAVVAIGVAAFVISKRSAPPATPAPTPEPELPAAVTIDGGSHPTPDGGTTELPAFRLSTCEITIAEYRKFLDVLRRLPEEDRDVFDHDDQPIDKPGHEPDDWDAMLQAVDNGGSWNENVIDPQSPVVNIDWWDAMAYCEWRGVRLPTQEEWFAALRQGLEKPQTLRPAGLGPVTAIPRTDTTPSGLRGMAGSVSEWTRRTAVNPANPIGGKEYVLVGGSYLNPAAGALTRVWTPDRSLRRPDLGFRIILPLD